MITKKKFLAKCCLLNKRLCFILITCLSTLLIIDMVFKKSVIKSKKGFSLDLTIPLGDLTKPDEMKKNSLKERPPEKIEKVVQNTRRERQSNQREVPEKQEETKQENTEEKTVDVQNVHYESEEEFMKRMSARMQERKALLKNTCAKLGLPKEPFHKQRLMHAKRHRLLYCRVPKSGSTNMDKILTDIIVETDYPKVKEKILKRVVPPHQVEFIIEREFDFDEITKLNQISLLIVRNPFVRIISAYLAKVKKRGMNVKGKIDVAWIGNRELPSNLNFADFLEHLLIHPGLYSTLEKHWALFYDLCQPCHLNYDVIAKLETIEEDSRYFLALIGAPRNVTFSGGRGEQGSSGTSTWQVENHFKDIKKSKILDLYNLYKPDFELFGYSLPEELQ